MKARIKKTGEITNVYATRQSGIDGYVDEDGRFLYPSMLDFGNLIETPAKYIERQEMIQCLTFVIDGLERNRRILAEGGRLENEHWVDIAAKFRGTMELFMNQG